MDFKLESPWSVQHLDDFLFYCCPECDNRNQSKELFLEHAMTEHPNSEEFLKVLQVKEFIKEDIEAEESDLKFDYVEDDQIDKVLEQDMKYKEEPMDDEDIHDDDFYVNYSDTNEYHEPERRNTTPKKVKKEDKLSSGTPDRQRWEGPFPCRFCNMEFSRKLEIKKHDWTVHRKPNENGEEMFHCSCCNEWFEKREKFREHGRDKHDGTGIVYKCDYCEMTFGKPYFKGLHIKKAHKEKYLECEFCGLSCTSGQGLQRHVEIHHKGGSKGEGFPCSYCDQSFKGPKYLKKHYEANHKDQYVECEICGKRFPDAKALSEHKDATHDKSFQCHECGKSLTTKDGLSKHIDIIHRGIKVQTKKHQCHVCSAQFYSNHDLFYHIKAKHEKSLEHSCEFCGNAYATPAQVKRHIRKHHEGETNYKCSTCGKGFFDKCGLKYHVDQVHLNIRNFKCNICTSAFKKSVHLQTHIKLKHKIILTHKEILEKFRLKENESEQQVAQE